MILKPQELINKLLLVKSKATGLKFEDTIVKVSPSGHNIKLEEAGWVSWLDYDIVEVLE